jgi:hypothetical protein
MSQKKNPLEVYIAEKLKRLDKWARPTRGSGASNEVEDTYNKFFVIEAKQKLTKENIILERKIWKKLINNVPIGSNRVPFYVMENKQNEKFAIIDLDTFFEILYKAYQEE